MPRLTTDLHETEEEAETILLWLAAILVVACVREWREEGMQQVTVSAVKFDEINYHRVKWDSSLFKVKVLTACLLTPLDRGDESVFDVKKVLFCH